jgi:hypothetical protein
LVAERLVLADSCLLMSIGADSGLTTAPDPQLPMVNVRSLVSHIGDGTRRSPDIHLARERLERTRPACARVASIGCLMI